MNIRMSTKGKRPLRSLTPSDKIHAIQRIHDGESKASVARDIGVPESTLRGWCKNEDKLRFMSRQSVADKLAGDSLSERLDGVSGGGVGVGGPTSLIGGPAEKRQKLDTAPLPLNFSSKLKFDEMSYKRASMNGLDYTTSKALSDLSFNGLAPDYAAFNGGMKNKVFGADISRPADPSIAAISPLSSLSHLSGLAGISQSPLAISFNELTSNLNLLAQLNPGLAAMSSLNGLAASANNLRNVKTKTQPQISSPRSDMSSERPQGLQVKNWAKQKPTHENDYGLNLSQNTARNPKIKCPSPSLAPSMVGGLPPLPALPDDPLLYWLKSQQAMLGLNSLYPPTPRDATSSPIRSSTPQQSNHPTDAALPVASTPMTPSTAAATAVFDDKNAAWLQWCKAIGASLNSLAPVAAAAAMHSAPMPQPMASNTIADEAGNAADGTAAAESHKPPFENILYSHLTKQTGTSSTRSSASVENSAAHTNGGDSDYQCSKPEDLSAKPANLVSNSSAPTSPIPANLRSSAPSPAKTVDSPTRSPITMTTMTKEEEEDATDCIINSSGGSVADCKDVLDNLLYKINCNHNEPLAQDTESEHEHEHVNEQDDSEGSCNNESAHNNNDICTNNNNNNNSNKTDEEERTKNEQLHDIEDLEAIKHGEKFLKWLENCSNPRVTAVQLMQLRFLLSAVKSKGELKAAAAAANKECSSTTNESSIETDADCTVEEVSRCKTRRRK